jgi:aspartyl-tRNA(Asn)/glutamyl-tRNA(Gln) amidotransferase subunit A
MSQDLATFTAAELGDLFAARKASPVEALDAVLARVDRLNPDLNALPVLDVETARRDAKASEARWLSSTQLSPIDGVPATVKELVRTRGFPLTMGSRLTDKSPASEDAATVARLREAGAVIFAQNASPEYGFKGVTDSPLNGVTRNPWARDLTPGGSSGGAGAAVAAGFGPLSLGTDGGGSIRIPSSFCGLVGLKATYGRIPAWPPSMHGDLANTGPMCRTVRDCALMMNAVARPDRLDPFQLPPDTTDYAAALGASLSGARVAFIPRPSSTPVDPEISALTTAAAKRFVELGCHVEEIDPPGDPEIVGPVFVTHWFSSLQRLLSLYPEERHGEFDPALLAQAHQGRKYTVLDVVNAQVARREIAAQWTTLFQRYDLVLTPTLAVLPFPVNMNFPLSASGEPLLSWTFTPTFNLTRHPALSLPCGLSSSGLPVGLQLVAGHFRDAFLLSAAAAFEATNPLGSARLPVKKD